MTVAGSPLQGPYTFGKFLNSQKLFSVAKKYLHQDLQDKVNVSNKFGH